jgi:hypothetical protein
MTLESGDTVWIPCSVTHGGFAARLPGQTMRRQYLTLTVT